MNRRRIRIAALIIGGIAVIALFTTLFIGAPHTVTCYTPCDCAHAVDRPCSYETGTQT